MKGDEFGFRKANCGCGLNCCCCWGGCLLNYKRGQRRLRVGFEEGLKGV